jgi:FAD/FMN-containing dehydrogenase
LQSREDIDVRGLEAALRESIEGEVRFEPGSLGIYAVDGSNYRQVPIGVVIPKSIEDVAETVAASRQFGAPVLSRGGGTSLAGQCCNIAIVMDWTKYLHNIVELNIPGKFARVQPGTICDHLRHAAEPHGLTWGPDPATHTHCTFGGMLGNSSCGTHAQMAGKAVDNVEEMNILLYDGTRMTIGWMNDEEMQAAIQKGGRAGEIYRRLNNLRESYGELIRRNYPKLPRRVSGYNLDQLLPGTEGRFNIARALVGSESTCVTILEAKVRLVPSRPRRVLVVLGYPEVYQAADHVPDVLEFQPIALEGMDEFLIAGMRKKGGAFRDNLSILPDGKGWLIAEFGEDTKEEATARANRFIEKLKSKSHPPAVKLFTSDEEQQKIWQVRESGLGATAFVPGDPITWEGWEDSAVPPDKVGAYLRELCKLYEKYNYRSAMYGHFGHGCIHCRINFDLQTSAGIKKWRAFMEEATDLIVGFGGSFSGEHGDGQSKAEFLYKMFGRELIEAFREFKSIWDPDWKMNPGKIVEPYRMDQNLRLGANYHPWEPETHFKFPEDNGRFFTCRIALCWRWQVPALEW